VPLKEWRNSDYSANNPGNNKYESRNHIYTVDTVLFKLTPFSTPTQEITLWGFAG